MRARGRRERGSFVVEGVLALLPLTLAVLLNVELALRARRHGVLAWATCSFIRERALGGSLASAQTAARARTSRALGEDWGAGWGETLTQRGLSGRGKWRYRALWPFKAAEGTKHHFEVSHLCRYPF